MTVVYKRGLTGFVYQLCVRNAERRRFCGGEKNKNWDFVFCLTVQSSVLKLHISLFPNLVGTNQGRHFNFFLKGLLGLSLVMS